MTPRLKKILITAAPLLILAGIFSLVIAPRIFPQIACVYPSASGEPVKGWGQECYQHEGAIVVNGRLSKL